VRGTGGLLVKKIGTLPKERSEEIQLQMNKLGWFQAIERGKAASSIRKAHISSPEIRASCRKKQTSFNTLKGDWCPYAMPSLNLSELRVFFISMVMVMGPTPPGTGVM
jgi:hypothetical protein